MSRLPLSVHSGSERGVVVKRRPENIIRTWDRHRWHLDNKWARDFLARGWAELNPDGIPPVVETDPSDVVLNAEIDRFNGDAA